MKKIFAVIMAVAAVACSNDEAISLNQETIDFNAPFVENSTRVEATDPSYSGTENFASFNVYGTANGVAIYAGEVVSGTVGEDSEWTCTKKNFWVNGVAYKFAGVANGSVTELSNGLPKTVSYTADGISDLVYAENFGIDGNGIIGQPAGSNSPVEFTFNHLLSKVKFTATTAIEVEGYSYEITNIAISNAYSAGTYDVASKTWDASATTPQTFSDITINATTKSSECEQEKLLIPTNSVSVAYKATLKYNGNPIWVDDKTATPVVLNTALVAANAYNFVITLNVGEEIKFSVENDPSWTNQEPGINVQ